MLPWNADYKYMNDTYFFNVTFISFIDRHWSCFSCLWKIKTSQLELEYNGDLRSNFDAWHVEAGVEGNAVFLASEHLHELAIEVGAGHVEVQLHLSLDWR